MTSLSPATPSREQAGRLAQRAALASMAVALFLILIKTAAWLYTGSVSLLGSLIDSGLDLLASALNALAIHEAAQPADREHRFGHGKAEAVAGLGQAVLIAGSAAYLGWESTDRLLHPAPVAHGFAGMAVILFSMAATVGLVLFQRKVVRQTGSLAVSADWLHYRGDLLLNAGVLAGLIGAGPLGLSWLDPVIGLLVAVWIGYSALRILKLSYDELMDREFSDADRARIKEIVHAHGDVRAMHDLRTRRAGFARFVQLHIELDPALSLMRAHAIADGVEADIKRAFPDAEVIIHEDPAGLEGPRRARP
jgi:ferrous-iron efflux pump FieF